MPTKSPERELAHIPTSQIVEQEGHNPRGEIDRKDPAFRELVASIDEKGILQPILVGKPEQNGKGPIYPLIAGHRRHAAATELKLGEVPALVADLEGDEFTAAVIENIVRQDLSPMQEANAIKRLRDGGMKQADAARAFGKSERWARDRQQILALPEAVQKEIDEGHVPTEAVANLVRISKPQPLLVAAVVEFATSSKSDWEPVDLANKDKVGQMVNEVAKDIGFQQMGDASYWGLRPQDLNVEPDAKKALVDAYGDLPKPPRHHEKPGFKFTGADLKKAKEAGALLEITYRGGYGGTIKLAFCTDPAVTAEIAKAKLPGMKRAANKTIADEKRREGRRDSHSAEQQKRIAEMQREAEQAAIDNAAFAERLQKMGEPDSGDVDLVRAVCALAVGDGGYYTNGAAGGGLGEIGIEGFDKSEAGEKLLEQLADARTAGECIAVVLRYATAYLCRAGAETGWFLRVPNDPGRIDAPALIDAAAAKLDLLPEPHLKAMRERQAKRDAVLEEAAKRASGSEDEEISTRQAAVLAAVADKDGIGASEIATIVGVKPNFLYRLLTDLEKKGKVRKDGKQYFAVEGE